MHALHIRAALCFLACFALIYITAARASTVCPETVSSEDLTGTLIGEDVSSVQFLWVSPQVVITYNWGVGYYLLSDGSILIMACDALVV